MRSIIMHPVGLLFFIASALLAMSCATGLSDELAVIHGNYHPARIARGPQDSFYVSDPVAGSVFIYDSDLNVTGEIRDLGRPLGVVVDPAGNIYVGDDESDHVFICSPAGEKLLTLGHGRLRMPTDLALGFDGRLYVADSLHDKVIVFDRSGDWETDIGVSGSGNGQFRFPVSVAVAHTSSPDGQPIGELFVADQGNARIQVLDLQGNFLRTFGSKASEGMMGWKFKGKFVQLQSIFIDAARRVHALDCYTSRAQLLNAQTGAYLSSYGTKGSAVGEMSVPLDFVMDDKGDIIVANYGNRRVEYIHSISETNSVVVLTPSFLPENSETGTVVGVLSSTTQPTNSVPFLLVPGPGGTDNGLFTVEGSNLVTCSYFDHEAKPVCTIRVASTDPTVPNLAYGQVLNVAVSDVNEAPTGLYLTPSYVFENRPAGITVGRFHPEDEDVGDAHIFSLVSGPGDSGNGLFSVSGSNLVAQEIFDYDTQASHSVRVRAEDSGGLVTTNVLTVNVRNVNLNSDPDLDQDGLPDWWEVQCAGFIYRMTSGEDADGDGFLNEWEWVAGTDPTNPNDFLFIAKLAVGPVDGDYVLRWPSSPDRYYDIDSLPGLTNEPVCMATNLAATPPLNVYTDTIHAAESVLFYRIKVRLEP